MEDPEGLVIAPGVLLISSLKLLFCSFYQQVAELREALDPQSENGKDTKAT
jgi:hypothetical protein